MSTLCKLAGQTALLGTVGLLIFGLPSCRSHHQNELVGRWCALPRERLGRGQLELLFLQTGEYTMTTRYSADSEKIHSSGRYQIAEDSIVFTFYPDMSRGAEALVWHDSDRIEFTNDLESTTYERVEQ